MNDKKLDVNGAGDHHLRSPTPTSESQLLTVQVMWQCHMGCWSLLTLSTCIIT